jgi:hypothetical protein
MAWNVSGLGNSISKVGIVKVTGTPAQGNVTRTETDPKMNPTAVPPNGRQSGGTDLLTSDDRMETVTWRDGVLWASAQTGCKPTGDSAARVCMKLIQAKTGSPATVLSDVVVGAAGVDTIFPAVITDAADNLIVTFSVTSSGGFAGAGVAGSWSTRPLEIQPMTLLQAGEAAYSDPDPRLGGNRWGDYSGIALDPADPTRAWLASEYAATTSDAKNWGTVIGSVHFVGTPPPAPSPTPTGDFTPPVVSQVAAVPNPFSPNGDGRKDTTKISFVLSEKAHVSGGIFTQGGSLVIKLPSGDLDPGGYKVTWAGGNSHGVVVKSGTYIVKINAVDKAGNKAKTGKVSITVKR